MSGLKLFDFQKDVLNRTREFTRTAYYLDMGLGKTFVGSEKMHQLGTHTNVVICQKSKIPDWVKHFETYYPDLVTVNAAKKSFNYDVDVHFFNIDRRPHVLIINYDLIYRRPWLKQLKNYTLMLDESSLIQNPKTERTKAVMGIQPDNVILLSGTPVNGKYEKLLTQMRLLGWNIDEELFWKQYIDWEWVEDDGFFRRQVNGYKNVERLTRKLAQHGAVFMKSEEVMELPEQVHIPVKIPVTDEYKRFMKSRIIRMDGKTLIGDMVLTKRLYARMLCSWYNPAKLQAFRDLINSTESRIVVFYNWKEELRELQSVCTYFERPVSVMNGSTKDLSAYEQYDNSITLVQYQTGAMGLDLQQAHYAIYFSLPESSELFEQSTKRIHRTGQTERCFYYYLLCDKSIEEDILENLKRGRDYTDALFENYAR